MDSQCNIIYESTNDFSGLKWRFSRCARQEDICFIVHPKIVCLGYWRKYDCSYFFLVLFSMFRLEDPDAEEVKEFVQKQVKLTESVLEKCETREKLRQKITKLFDHPRYEPPFRRGDKYFYFHNTGLQAQNVLYVQVRELELDIGELYMLCLARCSHFISGLLFRIAWMENLKFC